MQMVDLLESAPLAIIVASIAGFLVVGLVRRSRTFLLAGIVVGATQLAITSGFAADLPAPWNAAIRYGLIVAMGAFLWVALAQEPARVARRLGFIRGSREWEYDVILSGLWNDFHAKKRVARDLDIAAYERGEPPPEAERRALRAEANQLLIRLRATPTPSEEWAAVAAECAEVLELCLEHFGIPISLEVESEFVERYARLQAHRDRVVADYRARARSAFRWP